MEILPRETMERAVDEKMQLLQDGPIYIKQAVYYQSDVSTRCSFSGDSSDEDDLKTSLQVTSEESSVCCVCGDNIPILSKLIEHFKTHTAEILCHLCRTKFGSVMSLAIHLKHAHFTHNLLCEICGSFFSCTWHLNGHMGKHQNDKMVAKPVVKIEPTEEIRINETVSYSDVGTTMKDHLYFNPKQPPTKNTCDALQKCSDNDTTSTNQALHIKTEILPSITDTQNNISCSSFPRSQPEPETLSFAVKEEDNIINELGEFVVQEVAAEQEISHTDDGDDESTDTDDGNPDSLPPGDTAYNPDEDFSSDDECNESRRLLQKGKIMKQQSPDNKKSANMNLNLNDIAKNFGFQSDSPFCCYGKFANMRKHMDDCSNKKTVTCSMCSLVCEDEEVLQKHTDEKHPVAGYICVFCRNIFPCQDNFKKHVCWKRLLSQMNLEATPVNELPIVRLSNSSGQGPSAPVSTSQKTIKIIKLTPTKNKSPTASDPPHARSSTGPTKGVTVRQLLQTGSAKVTNFASQVPQTLARPSSGIIRQNVPIHPPLVVHSNPTRICTTSKPTNPTQVVVSFSPTLNVSTPAVVSANKPDLRPTSVASIRPVPVNVPMITPATRPTLRFPTPCNPPVPTKVNVSFSPTITVSTPAVVSANKPDLRPVSVASIRPVPVNAPMINPATSTTLRFPSPSNPPLKTQVVVSFSPTVNVSTPAIVSASKPDLRPTSVTSIRPLSVNVPLITPATRPTLCFPTPSNPPLPTQVNVSFSPIVSVSDNKDTLQKNAANNHHLAGYICTVCRNVFSSQDNIKKHVCWKRPRGNVTLPPTPVTGPILHIPAQSNPTQVNVSYPPTVNGYTPTLLSDNKSVLSQASTAKITPVPVHVPLITSISCPTLHIPNPSNPPLPNQVPVSFSPTVNISANSLVSTNKPVLQMSAANVVPINVPLITSVTCPTLVSALTGNNQLQGPPAQVQVQVPPVQAPLQVVGMFVNQSRDLTLPKQLEQSWRCKTIFPCRHCGAVSRQPSLRVRHRYLHRGSRLYRCQCGRAFQRQMHLLRHQVLHAESVRFVCTRCGNTFKGANKLTRHKQKRKNVKRCVKKTCKAAFDCSCGQMFARPSALLWHILKNSKQSKHTRKKSLCLNC